MMEIITFVPIKRIRINSYSIQGLLVPICYPFCCNNTIELKSWWRDIPLPWSLNLYLSAYCGEALTSIFIRTLALSLNNLEFYIAIAFEQSFQMM
jgi:hypothetical protein